jgi:thiamine pyrophosphate-dependent acetolactate synthase large subunit-like protein
VAAGLGAYAERVSDPSDVGSAIQRALQANREGQTAVLEMLTAEQPDYLAATQALQSAQSEALVGA